MSLTSSGGRKYAVSSAVVHTLLICGALLMLYPLAWMVSSSLKDPDEIFSDIGLFPNNPDLDNYIQGWTAQSVWFGRFLRNSLIISVLAVIGNLVSCSLAAYAFARLNFRLRRFWFAVMLVTIMLPVHVLIVPQYILYRQLGWVDTFLPLTVPHFLAVDAFFVFLMVQFIRGIPRELDDAARIDGCGPAQIFLRIILPLMSPALVTTAIFTFIWTWDNFFHQVIFLSDIGKYTVPLGLQGFLDQSGRSEWGQMFAMSTVALAPVFVFFLVFQRQITEGISTTGLKA